MLVFGGMAAAFVLGGLGFWLLFGGSKAKHWFLAWDPAVGGGGSARLVRYKPGQRNVTVRTPDGKKLTFPLLVGYGMVLQQGDKQGSLFIGDMRSKVPVKIEGTVKRKEPSEQGGLVVLKPATETVRPNAEELSAVLEDTREIKMARAQRQLAQKGGLPLWVLAAAGAVLAWVLFF